jgi:hypothetical protein
MRDLSGSAIYTEAIDVKGQKLETPLAKSFTVHYRGDDSWNLDVLQQWHF